MNTQLTRFLSKMPWCNTQEGALDFVMRHVDESAVMKGAPLNVFGQPMTPEITFNDGVAVVEIRGPLVKDTNLFDRLTGATDLDELVTTIGQAVLHDGVRLVILKISSPGGTYNGSLEAAASIAKFNQIVPIVAYTGTMIASGAYWLASACSKIVVTPSSQTGNVGVILQQSSFAPALKAAGIDITVFVSDAPKGFGHPALPMSSDAKDYFQSRVSSAGETFKTFVKKHRPQAAMSAM